MSLVLDIGRLLRTEMYPGERGKITLKGCHVYFGHRDKASVRVCVLTEGETDQPTLSRGTDILNLAASVNDTAKIGDYDDE